VLRKTLFFSCLLSVLLTSTVRIAAQPTAATSNTPPDTAAKVRDGRHDFDWDIGTWKTHQRRLVHPLTGSTTWVEYQGTDVVRRIWDGANDAHIQADGPAGHLELFALRLYNPETHEWSIYFSNSGSGTLSTPVIGEFKNGRADFIDQEPYNGKTILVRFSVSDIKADSCHFEQAFSADGGKTWETNFVVSETLIKASAEKAR
jgi:hypothetical protein